MQDALNGRKISLICGDYFRFPPQYLRGPYRSVVRILLPALLRSGLLAPKCEVYMPYPRRNEGVENVYEPVEACLPQAALVSPRANPLYDASCTLFGPHMDKTEGLQHDRPFLHFTLGNTAATTPGLKRPWW